MPEMYITSKKLIETLNISSQELIDIETFFDDISDDEWELNKGKDYKIVCKATGLREYTSSGAYSIARYIEKTRKQSFWQILKEWFLHTKQEIRRAFIREKILENCSSLVKRNNQFFISRRDVVTIFCTRSDYLSKMAELAQRSQHPLIKGEDYEDFIDEGGLYFSVSGVYKIAQAFQTSLTRKNRRDWCEEVGSVIAPQVTDIVDQILKREQRIQKIMDAAKKRDKKTCLVTNTKSNKVNKIKLAAHHLYSKAEYPYLADVETNLITLTTEVHDQFHEYMGGYNKSCTIDDFIRFVKSYYPENNKVDLWLQNQKLVLGNPQPMNARKPHVLYLPASRVS